MKIFTLLVLLFKTAAFGQQLSSESLNVKTAFDQMKSHPDSSHKNIYIKSLPDNYTTFSRIFDPPNFGELYDSSSEYIFVLDTISEIFPNEVCNKLLALAVNGENYLIRSPFIADATVYL